MTSAKVTGILGLLLLAGCSRPQPEPEPTPDAPVPAAAAAAPAPEKAEPPASPAVGLTVRGHLGPAYSATFSPDGKRLASTSADRTVQVWDAATGKPQLTLGGQGDYVNGVAFSPDGERIAFDVEKYGEGAVVIVADAHSGKELRSMRGHLGA